jgi:DNA ligase (NAD+)
MTDEEYDLKMDELRRLSPNHPFLSQIGAVPDGKGVKLPYMMASLDKVLDGEALERWKKRMNANSYVLSEKLDGISCLYYKGKMYLRGDGVKGVDVSSIGIVPHKGGRAQKLPECVVRGELIIKKSDTPAGSIGRSLINGWVHRHEKTDELSLVRFLAYELIEPVMPRGEQMNWLKQHFEIPWIQIVNSLDLEYLKNVLIQRRAESDYSTDGIVVATDTLPSRVGEALKNPKDVIAFKTALNEQRAETSVTGIEWNLSRQGFLIPTLLIEPVIIGEAKIQRLSGHNAALIHRENLGPGSRIIIRRSGDVIPTLDTVLKSGVASMPTVAWKWDEKKTHAVSTQEGHSKEAASVALLHALQTLGVDGIGPGLVNKLVEGGVDTLKKLSEASELTMIGAGRGPKLLENLRVSLASAPLMTMMIASNMLPRGVGERKLKLLFDIEQNPEKWSFDILSNVNGWGSLGIQEVIKTIPGVLEWCRQLPSSWTTSGASGASAPAPASASASASKGSIVFTGVRDKVLEEKLVADGWTISDSLTKKTSMLIVSDDYDGSKTTGKAKKAAEYGVPISRVSEFRKRMV